MSEENKTTLTADSYPMYVQLLFSQCAIISTIPLKEMKELMETVHAIGPISDPTAYMQSMEGLRHIEKLLKVAIELKETVLEIQKEINNKGKQDPFTLN